MSDFAPAPSSAPQALVYSSFWQRFAAGWIDVLVVLPVFLLHMSLAGQSRLLAMVLDPIMESLYVGYMIYCHGRFGRTIGKRVMQIRVIRTDGIRIEWPEAWLRSLLDVVFAFFGSVATLVALNAMTDADYRAAETWLGMKNTTAFEPPSLAWVTWGSLIWACSHPIVILCNKRRRALHDFIAHTLVISERETLAPSDAAASPLAGTRDQSAHGQATP